MNISIIITSKKHIFGKNKIATIIPMQNNTIIFKKFMKKFIISLIIFCITYPVLAQQDVQYSHYMFNQMAYNPAVAGTNGKICANAIRRDQWLGFEGAPKTTGLNINMPISPFGWESGVGLNIENDEIGYEQNFKIRAAYSYHLPLWTGKLGIGTELGLYNKNFDPSDWKTPDTDAASDPLIPTGEDKNIMAFDMSFGLYYHDQQKYFGISANHLTKPKLEYESTGGEGTNTVPSNLTRHFFVTAGYNIPTTISLLELQPSVFVKLEGASLSSQYDFTVIGVYNKKFWGGLTYRYQDAVVALLGLEIFTGGENGIKIGVAYDLTTSKLRKAGDGSTEIFLSYSFDLGLEKLPRRYKSIRYF